VTKLLSQDRVKNSASFILEVELKVLGAFAASFILVQRKGVKPHYEGFSVPAFASGALARQALFRTAAPLQVKFSIDFSFAVFIPDT
jgi:hypothetical protein